MAQGAGLRLRFNRVSCHGQRVGTPIVTLKYRKNMRYMGIVLEYTKKLYSIYLRGTVNPKPRVFQLRSSGPLIFAFLVVSN